MTSSALTLSPPVNSKNGIIQSIELTRPISSLAEFTSESMALLDSLHIAIHNIYGASSEQTKLVFEAKEAIGREWEHWLSFQQQCLAYIRNYILVCGTPQPDGSLIAPALVISDARRLEIEAGECRTSYVVAVQRFASLAQRYQPSQSIARLDRETMRTRIITKLMQFIISLLKRRAPRVKAKQNLPVILHAFAMSIMSLRASADCLADIHAFWSDHSSTVTRLAASPSLVSSGDLSRQAEKWLLFQASTRQALSDITTYCDALTVKPTNHSSVKNVSLWAGVFPPEMDTEEYAKIKEAGYFEVLTALQHFEVSLLTTTTTSLNKHFQTALDLIDRISGATSSDLKTHVERYFETLQDVQEIATSGSEFYSQAQELASNRPQIADVTKIMHSKATDIHSRSRILLAKYEGSHGRLMKSLSALQTQDHAIKSLRSGLDDLRRLVSLYVDFDHFWFGLLAGVRYLYEHDFAHITDVPALVSVWKKQAQAYIQYGGSMTPASPSLDARSRRAR